MTLTDPALSAFTAAATHARWQRTAQLNAALAAALDKAAGLARQTRNMIEQHTKETP